MKKILGLFLAIAVVAAIGCAKPEEGDPAAAGTATAGTTGTDKGVADPATPGKAPEGVKTGTP